MKILYDTSFTSRKSSNLFQYKPVATKLILHYVTLDICSSKTVQSKIFQNYVFICFTDSPGNSLKSQILNAIKFA